ncbi:unnamed protein product [Parascedosporium putredinis]|uniref:homogentisate 1,2-dioxygenase n=1 Tax=Parascedosporium putredinis TaxID=1442378 RepID=A0A9P1MA32_9PEZI|nr:unnamed protein product [Parascedosporium putredinis]CAI7993277.1 unnamed protein product [Parascedosporium putredinis]
MPVTNFSTPEKYQYLNGFGSYHESEAIPDTLPIGANSPQKPNHGLYAEKLSGTSFIAPRSENQQTWAYRILPSAAHLPFERNGEHEATTTIHHIPQQLRWDPFDLDDSVDWVHSLKQLGGVGSPATKTGLGIYIYAAASFTDDTDGTSWTIYAKYNSNMFVANQSHTPFDVVGWHGLYYPYNIYTVLCNPTADFVIFPPRWLVQEDTFRPPWYHRNTMSEFMGLIMGSMMPKLAGLPRSRR